MQNTAIGYALFEVFMCITPLWLAVAAGVVVGWAWKPKWANLDGAGDWFTSVVMPSPSFPLSFNGISFPTHFASVQNLTSVNFQFPSFISGSFDKQVPEFTHAPRSQRPETEKSYVLNEKDLHHLRQLLEEDDEGPGWIKVMERSIPNMRFLAHRRNTESGPLMYRTVTVLEDATPETVRDFFWDDEFRTNWDEMHLDSDLLEECAETGAMLVHWIRRFPLFCSDREYTIARRIWQAIPVTFFSCNAAKSARDGQMTACEITLFHYEDMGMPRGIAKFGVENGMWGTVKRIDPGLRAYQKYRASAPPLSRYVLLGHASTKLGVHTFGSGDENRSCSSSECEEAKKRSCSWSEVEAKCSLDKPEPNRISKLVVFGAALAVACSLDLEFLNKVFAFSVARRFVGIGGAAVKPVM
nr:START domain-containing proteins involved in steroidogenesis/phosphatidylcholine transfer [Ipomoea batatas]